MGFELKDYARAFSLKEFIASFILCTNNPVKAIRDTSRVQFTKPSTESNHALSPRAQKTQTPKNHQNKTHKNNPKLKIN